MSYKKYNGPDRYHFRIYKRNGHHPFIVVMITSVKAENGHYLFSGYMITHDINKALEYPSKYRRMKKNPNKNDEKPTYVCTTRFENLIDSLFSKPYSNWHLSKEDELFIDKLEQKKKSP